jgi:hypothetical protein
MNENLLRSVTAWKTANQVEMSSDAGNDEGLIELTWRRPGGDWGYINVFPDPDSGDLVIAQHGTFATPDAREQGGINRFRSSDIAERLSDLKQVVDTSKALDNSKVARQWYTPRVEIGSVASLKFR